MWIIPSTYRPSYLSALEYLASKEALNALSEKSVSWPMWKSKPSSLPTYLRAWKKAFWIPALFGRTLKPSMEPLFAEKLTESLAAIRANRLAMLDFNGGGMDPRHLWPFIRQHIETIQPDWCFFENVSGHLTIGYPEVRQSLETLGYTVKEGIFSAEEVGAPHRRDRLYILAIKLVYTCKDGRNGSENGQSTYSRNDGNATGAQQLFEPTGRSCAWDYEELANTYGNESGTRSRTTTTTTTTGGENENTQRGTNGERLRAQSGQCDSTTAKLADADLQQREGQGRIQQRKSPGWNSASFSGTKWPAGQGPFQYDWEHPRAVEPGLGVTVDGYNFRSDLLRACGNSVVEQTAELAFITLFLKHYPLTDLEDDI